MSKLIDAEKFLESEIERCNGCIPMVGSCSMDNVTLKSRLDAMSAQSESIVYVLERISTSSNFPPNEKTEETLFFKSNEARDAEYDKQKSKYKDPFHRWLLYEAEIRG